jgi:hypothetical protein
MLKPHGIERIVLSIRLPAGIIPFRGGADNSGGRVGRSFCPRWCEKAAAESPVRRLWRGIGKASAVDRRTAPA